MKRFLAPKETLIVADGEKPNFLLLTRYRERARTVIALDGASRWLIGHGITPDIVIGDMVSADLLQISALKTLKIADQNSNDLEKALIYCAQLRLSDLSVLGAFGMRADHFLTNLFVLKKFARSINITLVDTLQQAFICPNQEQLVLESAIGSFISFFPLSDQVGPIWSEGVQYPLTNEMLSLSSRIGTLNRLTSSQASLYCESGELLVLLEIPKT